MAINPFLAPIIMGLHGLNDFDGLAGFSSEAICLAVITQGLGNA